MFDHVFPSEVENWLVELESTDKEQGTGYLCRGGKFCCLGIAAMLMFPAEAKVDEFGMIAWFGVGGPAPIEVWRKLKLRSSTGRFETHLLTAADDMLMQEEQEQYGTELDSLALLNDTPRWSFKEIAAFIRRNPAAVFSPS